MGADLNFRITVLYYIEMPHNVTYNDLIATNMQREPATCAIV
jgi:hypothetical protein